MRAGKTGNVAHEQLRLRAALDNGGVSFHNGYNLRAPPDGGEPFFGHGRHERKLVAEKMKTAIALDAPVDVEIGTGDNWLAAH